MPLSFPSSPSVNQTVTTGGRVYRWSGSAWEFASTSPTDDARWSLFLPPAPTNLTATAGNAQASLSWTAPAVSAQTPITDYIVQFRLASASTWETFSDGTSTATSATVTGLANGSAYVFRVAATNGVGTGTPVTSGNVTPKNIPFASTSSLRVWLDAAAPNSLYDATSGGSLVTSGGSVARWNDLTTYGNHFTQAASGQRPVYDGTGLVLAENTNRFLSLAYSQNTNAISFFAVATLNARNGGQNRYGRYFSANSNGDGPNDFSHANGILLGDDISITQVYRNSQSVASVSAAAIGSRHVVGFVLDGSSVTVYRNTTTASGTTSATPVNIEVVRIGSNGGSDAGLAGTFYEVVMFNAAISSQLASDTVAHLMTKWGIS